MRALRLPGPARVRPSAAREADPGRSEQPLRGLCRSCHQEVTEAQDGTPTLESRFNRRAWKHYVESPRPPPFVFQPERPGQEAPVVFEVDKVRCRMSALSTPLCAEFPVFCSLDSIERSVAGRLADFSYLESVRDGRMSAVSLLPWCGPGWYARPAVEYLLDHRLITWADVSWSFQATGRVASSVFARFWPRWRRPGAWRR